MSGSNFAPDTGTRALAGGNVAVEPVAFGYYPAEGSRIAAAQYSWSTVTTYTEDMSRLVQNGMETTAQSVFIDNSGNPNSCNFYVPQTGQLVIVGAGKQGLYPVFFTGLPTFIISTSVAVANAITRICILNVPGAADTWLSSTGSTGKDWSANAPTVPLAGYQLLTTIPANPLRALVTVQNISMLQMQVVRDDGNGNNQSTIMLAPALAAFEAGGIWSSSTFNGRVRVYGANIGEQCSAFED